MSVKKIYNFLELSNQFGTSGYPEDDEFKYIKDSGYKIVINLVSFDVLRQTEKEIVESLGLTYIHIPVIWESPKLEDFRTFSETLEKYKNEKIYIHCELNFRVSIFMMLYRVIYRGMNHEKAMADVFEIWKPHDQWKTFIDKVLYELME
jgi:protein tyrosine phosphatase (PTP) superfamily phosphohydrolase (DUF442 family)